jgi:hypothetical protein
MRRALVVALAACSSAPAQPRSLSNTAKPSTPVVHIDAGVDADIAGQAEAAMVLAKMASIKDEMCGCADRACADKVMDDMTKWSESMSSQDRTRGVKPNAEQTRIMTELSEELGRCMMKAMGGQSKMTP